MNYSRKDASGSTATVQPMEPEVVKAVQVEITKLGDNIKTNYEELHKRYNEMKSLIDGLKGEADACVKSQIARLTEDVATRQKALDDTIAKQKSDLNSRIDSVEVAMRRPSRVSPAEVNTLEREIQRFFISLMAKDEKGATADRVALASSKGELNPEIYDSYRKAFVKFIRQNGDERNLDPESHKALSVGVDPAGGYTVIPVISDKIITRLFETDPLRQLASIETISTGAIEWMVDWGEAGCNWEEETVATTEATTPTWNRKRIPVHVLAARPRASQTLLEDSAIDIEAWLAGKVADRMSRVSAAAYVTGNGVGRPRGFLTYTSGTTFGTVEQINMGHATALVADGITDTKYHLKEFYLMSGTWLVNRLTVSEIMQLKDGAGNYLWKPAFAKDEQSTLLGLPLRMSTTMPTVAANALAIAIGDWKQAYMIVDRIGISVQRDPYTAKPMVEFYTRMRTGGDVIDFDALKIGVVHT